MTIENQTITPDQADKVRRIEHTDLLLDRSEWRATYQGTRQQLLAAELVNEGQFPTGRKRISKFDMGPFMSAVLEKLTGRKDVYRLEIWIFTYKNSGLSFEHALGHKRKDVERCRRQLASIIESGIEHINKLLRQADRDLVPTDESAKRIAMYLSGVREFAAHVEFERRTKPLTNNRCGNIIPFPRRG